MPTSHRKHPPHPRLLAATLGAAILAACQTVPPPHAQTQPATRPALAAAPLDPPAIGVEPVAKGVYIAIDRRQPLSGEDLARAKITREQVLAAVREKIAPPIEPPATQPAAPATQRSYGRSPEAPPLAVKYYLQGRARFLEGANTEAMDDLEKALALDPQGFTVLRLMGRVCFAASQLARGAMYLERAHSLQPRDVEVNYFLGRYWLERGDTDRAIFYLAQAEDSPEKQVTSTQTPLASFYLGTALQLGGYHAAAAREFEHFIEVASLPVPGYRYDQELSYLIAMLWASHLAAAENDARIGAYAAASPHYQIAFNAHPDDAFIASRLVNSLLHEHKPDAAKKIALSLLAATHAGEDAIKLLAWSYHAAGNDPALIPDLAAYLKSRGTAPDQDATAALTLASTQEYLGEKSEAFATLQRYLEANRDNVTVLGRLLKRVDSAETFRAAMLASAAAIAADPRRADDVVKLFLPVARSPAADAFLNAEDSSGRRNFSIYFLRAITRREQNAPLAGIESDFRDALALAPDFFPALDAYVSFLLAHEKFPQATTLISQALAQHLDNPRAWQLQVESEAAQQRYLHALQLAHEAKAQFPDNLDIRMQLASVYRLREQDDQADAELQGIIHDAPAYESAYRTLINSLFTRSRRTGVNPAPFLSTVTTTLNRLLQNIPGSRFGQITTAIIDARNQRFDDAEAALRPLLADDPDDVDVLVPLAQIRQILGRGNDAVTLLETALKRKPQPDLVRALAGIYRSLDRPADAVALTRRMIDENPGREAYVEVCFAELITQDKDADALALLTDACKKFPRSETLALDLARLQNQSGDRDAAVLTIQSFMNANGDTTERLYTLSHFYSSAGNDDASVAALQRILAIMPDHVGANNDLGFFWADMGINLDQAEPMIKRAVENDPNDAAFADSLGWLYYKQGKFADAVATLNKAIDLPGGLEPDVIGHLGDALFRAGNVPEAIERWGQAQLMLEGVRGLSKSEQKTRDYLVQVTAAARAGKPPDVTPFVDPKAPRTALPATMPASRPQ